VAAPDLMLRRRGVGKVTRDQSGRIRRPHMAAWLRVITTEIACQISLFLP
jgi:hypothetical protein